MNEKKTKIYAWVWFSEYTNQEIKTKVENYKKNGIDGLMCAAGHDSRVYKWIGIIVKEAGLEFHAWIPTLLQHNNAQLKPDWYVINRLGDSAYYKPPYISHYQFVCPNRVEIREFLTELYNRIASVEEVDGIHLDYIRFPDVILARGLWKKYNLIMESEYQKFDYCYCDKCVDDFTKLTGVNIKEINDSSQINNWKQFRYDLITNLVNHISKLVRSKNKQITAAVFPGLDLAKKNVGQEWDKWDVDALYLMNYNDFYLEGTKWIAEMCKNASKIGIPLYSGLFICSNPENKVNHADPEYHGLSPKELGEAIYLSIENGATGICLFTPDRMTPNHWKTLKSFIC